MGEERSPRWRRLSVPVAVALLAAGGYQLVSGPSSTPAGPAAAAEDRAASGRDDDQPVVMESWVPAVTGGREEQAPSAPTVRLGGQVVALHGAGLSLAHRETSVTALGRLDRGGWLVAMTSRACRDRTDSQVSYGTARASGGFTAWDAATGRRGGAWRSPDRALVLLEAGPRLVLRQTTTGRVVEVFRP